MILNVIPSLYGRRHGLLKLSLPRQNQKLKASDSECGCSPKPCHCACPQHHRHLTLQKYYQWGIFCSLLWEQPSEKALSTLALPFRKPGSWPEREMQLTPMLLLPGWNAVGAVPSQSKPLSWNCQYTPIPEVNHEAPGKGETPEPEKRLLSQWDRAS